MEKLKIAVVFGGRSSEHEVSRVSAKSVAEHLSNEKYEILLLGITKGGRWLRYRGPLSGLPDGSWESHPQNTPACILPDSGARGILERHADGTAALTPVDVVFPVLHGANGEDGTIQGLLTLSGLPFVGCGTAASAICMDKAFTKMVLAAGGVPQAKWDSFTRADWEREPDAVAEGLEKHLGYPLFLKPANAGSSVGISKATNRAGLKTAAEKALAHDRKVVAEEAVTGTEVECAVLGNEDPVASVCGEIVPCNDFYDYEAKYIKGDSTRLFIPARIPQEAAEAVRSTAVKAYRLLGCAGMTRMDFFVLPGGTVLLNEPNTIPGFTAISMYPKLFEASGVPYAELLDRLVELALARSV